MKRIRMLLDESLVQEVDRAAQALGTTRSAFTRDALREALGRFRERQQRAGGNSNKKPNKTEELKDYLTDLIAEVGPPTASQRRRAAAIARRIARRPKRQRGGLESG